VCLGFFFFFFSLFHHVILFRQVIGLNVSWPDDADLLSAITRKKHTHAQTRNKN
jgi:hypothetical protein